MTTEKNAAPTLVTGATGQVGRHLVDALLEAGRPVRALLLANDEASLPDGVEVVRGDVRDPASVRAAMQGMQVVFHLAAVVSTEAEPGPLLFEVNIDGARNVAVAAREARASMVHFSSMVVFDPEPIRLPLDERRRRLAGPSHAPYTRSKVRGEEAVRAEVARGLHAVVVHPTVIVGPLEQHHTGVVKGLFGAHMSGRLPASVKGRFDLVDVLDVVDGALAAEARGRAGESYILGGGGYSVAQALAVSQASCGKRAPRFSVPLWLARASLPLVGFAERRFGVPASYNREDLVQLAGNPRISTKKARDELGYRPRPIDDAVRRAHRWLAETS